jgi:hypothetical protein
MNLSAKTAFWQVNSPTNGNLHQMSPQVYFKPALAPQRKEEEHQSQSHDERY